MIDRWARAAADTFRALGATVDEVELGWSLEAMREAARAHLSIIFGSWIGGILEEHRELLTGYAIEFAEDAVRRVTMGYLQSLEVEGETYGHLADVLERYDLLICPTFTEPALPAASADYDIDVVFSRALTFPFNMCSRCPVLVVPAARAGNGVPIGLQIVGRTFDDVTVFAAATAFEDAHLWYATSADRPDRPRRTT